MIQQDVKSYKLLYGNSAGDLSAEVNQHLAEGWLLFARPFTDAGLKYQAMVKLKPGSGPNAYPL